MKAFIHLILKYLGFPACRFEYSISDSLVMTNHLMGFTHLIWDKILHYYFYPIMLNQYHSKISIIALILDLICNSDVSKDLQRNRSRSYSVIDLNSGADVDWCFP